MCAKALDPAASGNPHAERRQQILQAAMACFARRGFHQTAMHDISEQAGISVGLIYRYFESKDAIISTMATEHLAELRQKLAEARGSASLLQALEHVLWCDRDADVAASFVVDLFAEAGRNGHVRGLVNQVHDAAIDGVASLIESSPEAARLAPGVGPRDAAEMIFHAIHGRLFGEIVAGDARTSADMKRDRIETLRRLLALLLPSPAGPTPAAR